jgi:hypothetical protein
MWRSIQIGMTVAALSVTTLSFAQAPRTRGQGGTGNPSLPGGPGGPGGPRGFGGPGGPGGPPPNPQEMARRMLEMREQMLSRMTLTDAEKAAAKAALKAKTEAHSKLTQQLIALQKRADDKNASDSALKQSAKAFSAANAAYHKTTAAADKKLLEKLSPRATLQLAVAGFIEGGGPMGFGRFGGFRGGPGGPGGPGGFGAPGGGPPGGRPGAPGGRPGRGQTGERTE